MGNYWFDQYSLLHAASGVIAYFWGLTLAEWLVLHTIFEIVENTEWGIHVINRYLLVWPGGKSGKDAIGNIVGDTIAATLGWLVSQQFDRWGAKNGWYPAHLSPRSLWSIRLFD